MKIWKVLFGSSGRELYTLSPLFLSSFPTFAEYAQYISTEMYQETENKRASFEKNLIPALEIEFKFHGYCYVCKQFVDFTIDFAYSQKIDDISIPNWREWLICPHCHLNNRMRATIQIFEQECQPKHNSKIYITEQSTPLYSWFRRSFANVVGSEYMGNSLPLGKSNSNNVRNEDLTELTFKSNKFNYILSFDVFEHIPQYKRALTECFRCLKPGGMLYFSVPFIKISKQNIVRAHVDQDGNITHLLPPEYHGDPVNSEGILCFYHFGWELLDEIRIAGFKDVRTLLYWSDYYGYLGGEQVLFTATKGL
jgi:SAM-dependent methyltransferase